MPQISWYLDSLWTFLSCVQWPTWSRVRNHRNQRINKHVWQTHVNPQQIAEFLYLRRTFLCMFQGISLLYFMLIFTQKVPFFDLESPARNPADFPFVIHEIFLLIVVPETGSNLTLGYPLLILLLPPFQRISQLLWKGQQNGKRIVITSLVIQDKAQQ